MPLHELKKTMVPNFDWKKVIGLTSQGSNTLSGGPTYWHIKAALGELTILFTTYDGSTEVKRRVGQNGRMPPIASIEISSTVANDPVVITFGDYDERDLFNMTANITGAVQAQGLWPQGSIALPSQLGNPLLSGMQWPRPDLGAGVVMAQPLQTEDGIHLLTEEGPDYPSPWFFTVDQNTVLPVDVKRVGTMRLTILQAGDQPLDLQDFFNLPALAVTQDGNTSYTSLPIGFTGTVYIPCPGLITLYFRSFAVTPWRGDCSFSSRVYVPEKR